MSTGRWAARARQALGRARRVRTLIRRALRPLPRQLRLLQPWSSPRPPVQRRRRQAQHPAVHPQPGPRPPALLAVAHVPQRLSLRVPASAWPPLAWFRRHSLAVAAAVSPLPRAQVLQRQAAPARTRAARAYSPPARPLRAAALPSAIAYFQKLR